VLTYKRIKTELDYPGTLYISTKQERHTLILEYVFRSTKT